jgi:hypothetical protein
MRPSRIASGFLLSAALSLWFGGVGHTSSKPSGSLMPLDQPSLISAYHGAIPATETSRSDRGAGIKEDIPDKFLARYEAWKVEFLATEAGREQWAHFKTNPNFTLTISMARENAEGAATSNYRWNDAGILIAATITLGTRLDEGYPNPIYFPVMSSLEPTESLNRINGNTLAATKIAHEFGHVKRTSQVDSVVYQLQSQLIPQYNKIFLSNGRNATDPRLVEITKKIGGTPVQVWEDREYWGEANAMLYLRDRFPDERMRCALFSKIRHSLDLYAKDYEPRFLEIARTTSTRKTCGWP